MGPKLAPLGRPWAPWHLVLRLRGAARAAAAPLMAPGGAGPARESMRSEHHGSAALSAAFGSRPSGGPPFSDNEKNNARPHLLRSKPRSCAIFFARRARPPPARDRARSRPARRTTETNPTTRSLRYEHKYTETRIENTEHQYPRGLAASGRSCQRRSRRAVSPRECLKRGGAAIDFHHNKQHTTTTTTNTSSFPSAFPVEAQDQEEPTGTYEGNTVVV
jgi:hypothetical protein